MAINVTEKYEVDDLYDRETGLMRVTVEYEISGQVDEHNHIGTTQGALPIGITSPISRPSVRIQSDAIAINTLELHAVHREIPRRFGPDRAKMLVTYEGHEYGVMTWDIDLGTGPREVQSGLRRYDSEGDPLPLQPIGPNEKARLTIESPQQVLSVVYNWTGIEWIAEERPKKLRDYIELIAALSGTVNEIQWAPDFWGDWFNEGYWLYLGAESIHHRDGTWTFEHKFVTNTVNWTNESADPRMHIYRWWNSVEKPDTDTHGGEAGGGATDVEYSDTAKEAQIYLIAGEDIPAGFGELLL